MSTRAQIKIKGNKALLYKHTDGYVDNVIPFLQKILPEFVSERGGDSEYCFAQLVRQWAFEDLKWAQDNPKLGMSSYVTGFTGWGVSTELHGDLDYLYEIDLEKQCILIKEPTREYWNSERALLKNFKTTSRVNFKGAASLARVYKIGGAK